MPSIKMSALYLQISKWRDTHLFLGITFQCFHVSDRGKSDDSTDTAATTVGRVERYLSFNGMPCVLCAEDTFSVYGLTNRAIVPTPTPPAIHLHLHVLTSNRHPPALLIITSVPLPCVTASSSSTSRHVLLSFTGHPCSVFFLYFSTCLCSKPMRPTLLPPCGHHPLHRR